MSAALTTVTLVLFAGIYGAGMRSARSRLGAARIAAFSLGWLTIVVALLSPLHHLADVKLWAHMVQHELLMLIAAPLIALGRPDVALLALFKHRDHRKIAARWLGRLSVSPASAWILHGIAVWIWHLPSLYTTASLHPPVHLAQHISFFATALLAWWSVLGRRSDYGAAAFYVFATSMHTGLLGLLLFIARRPWYPTYATAHEALEDQQLAGLLMWIPGGVIMAITAMVLFALWLKESDRRVFARERLALARSAAGKFSPPVVMIFWLAMSIAACSDPQPAAVALTRGNPQKGKESIRLYGCWACHTIPGIHGANAVIGPPLNGIANRAYVAGHPNSPEHLVNWIRHPQQVRNPTPMPDMGVTEEAARDIAAYLYTLR
jgi:putative membrane protein